MDATIVPNYEKSMIPCCGIEVEKATVKGIVTLSALLVALTSLSSSALAQERPRFTFRPEGRLQLEYHSNAVRAPGGRQDGILKTLAGFNASYRFPSDTTVTTQYQMQLWRFLDQPTFSTWLNVVTLLVSQRFPTPWFSSIAPYVGGQLINSSPTDITGGKSRNDFNVLSGFHIVQAIGQDAVFLGGYQFDALQAEVPLSRYNSHALNFNYRHAFDPQFVFNGSYQLQWRLPIDQRVEDILRNAVSVGVDYYPIDWLKVGLSVAYYNDSFVSNRTSRTLGGIDYVVIGLNVGSNLMFGW